MFKFLFGIVFGFAFGTGYAMWEAAQPDHKIIQFVGTLKAIWGVFS